MLFPTSNGPLHKLSPKLLDSHLLGFHVAAPWPWGHLPHAQDIPHTISHRAALDDNILKSKAVRRTMFQHGDDPRPPSASVLLPGPGSELKSRYTQAHVFCQVPAFCSRRSSALLLLMALIFCAWDSGQHGKSCFCSCFRLRMRHQDYLTPVRISYPARVWIFFECVASLFCPLAASSNSIHPCHLSYAQILIKLTCACCTHLTL